MRDSHSCTRVEALVKLTSLLLVLLPGAALASETITPAKSSAPIAAAAPAQATPPAQDQPAPPSPGETPPPAEGEKPVEGNTIQQQQQAQSPATASAGSAVLTPEQLAALSGFFYSASIDHSIGLGTFIDSTKYAYLNGIVNAFVSYRTQIKGRAFALGVLPFGGTGFIYEYTLPDTSTGRRLTWSDARISLSMPALFRNKATGITLNPSLQVILPTTPESWQAGLISRLGVGVSLNKNFATPAGLLIANISGSSTFGIYKSTANVVTRPSGPSSDGRLTVLCRTGETVCGINNNNSAIALSISPSLTLAATDWLFFGISYSIGANWRYGVISSPDGMTAKGLDVNGEPLAHAGMTGVSTQSAVISASINITEVWSATLYLYNFAPLLTQDGSHVRFPFVDATGLANNNTQIGFSLSATY